MTLDQKAEQTLAVLAASGNLRAIPADGSLRAVPAADAHSDNTGSSADSVAMVDFTTNDYLGIARRTDWQSDFLGSARSEALALTSSASRLLADCQKPYLDFEHKLSELYGRPALLLNSGYHANTGLIPTLADRKTLILADRLVHASIIDGIRLSGAPFSRFLHNDYDSLVRALEKNRGNYESVLIIVESIYSMDGDMADIERLIDIKRRFPEAMLYVDEAHAFGVAGPGGLGLVAASSAPQDVDIVVGTLGKAAASQGAFAVTSQCVHDLLVNRCRSLIFSTAIPPIAAAWSEYVIDRMVGMDSERAHLRQLAKAMQRGFAEIAKQAASQTPIQPFIVGSAQVAVGLSRLLADDGIKVLPIRTPTVPPGTERLRFSLSAAHSHADIARAINSLKRRSR